LGLYITENKDRLYLATVEAACGKTTIRSDSGHLFWISKSDVAALSIGRLQDVEDAARAAPRMLRELTAARVPLPKANDQSGTTNGPGKVQPAATRRTDVGDLDDSEGSAGSELPPPPPAVHYTPEITRLDPPTVRPGRKLTVHGSGFGNDPKVAVDDVEVKSVTKSDGGNSIVFNVPRRAESGRVDVRCGESVSDELIVKRTLPRVQAEELARNRIRLTPAKLDDFNGEHLRYRWQVAGSREKNRKSIVVRMPRAPRALRVTLTVSDGALRASRRAVITRRPGDPHVRYMTTE
jgi:hypothetical protein